MSVLCVATNNRVLFELEGRFMATSYKGLFAQKLPDGSVVAVQVEDPNGNSLSLDPDTYTKRGVLPPIDQLPDQNEYQGGNQ